MAPTPIAIILGAGPGTGASIARTFAARNFNVALLARSKSSIDALAAEINGLQGGRAFALESDATRLGDIQAAVQRARDEWAGGEVRVGVFNLGGGFRRGGLFETSVEQLRQGLEGEVVGAFQFAQSVIRAMQAHQGGGTLIFSGATASVRGGAGFHTFAPAKFGLRALSQTLAREFHPHGIHVAHVVIDGIIDTERTRRLLGDKFEPGSRLEPDAIGKLYVQIHEQDPSAWAQEVDIRPAKEKF